MHKQNTMNSNLTRVGLVISYFGNSVAVEDENGQVFQCHLHRNQALPVVGDEVQWQMNDEHTGVIQTILPRRSLLSRGDERGKIKAIAANVDVMVIVMAPPPILSEYLMDRYLVAAELLHIAPIILLNKIDLLNAEAESDVIKRLAAYRRIGYPVMLSSIYQPERLHALVETLRDKTAVLVGPSGVGKSSIIAALCEHAIRVGTVSAKGAGKHTTTATTLYHLPSGGKLIDSPGVREFNLWRVDKKDVWSGFKEFHDYATQCKFRDCQHLREPGCGLQKALENSDISQDRFQSYEQLMKIASEQEKEARKK